MNFLNYPWDKNVKPYFINEEGFEWYVHIELTNFAKKDQYLWGNSKRKGLKNVTAFYVKKENDIKYVLINNDQTIIVCENNDIALWNEIDKLKILYSFMSLDEQKEFEEAGRYNKNINDFINK